MKQSIINELKSHTIDLIGYDVISANNIEYAHDIAFNQDYYIIGYYQADEWLKKHNVSPWEAIEYVTEQEQAHFGERIMQPDEINSESVVNTLVYFAGLEIDFKELLEQVKES